MEILDTQIISYAFKRTYGDSISHKYISSITAKEFLLIQSKVRTKANYYIPILPIGWDGNLIKIDHPISKSKTDRLVLDFGNDYPSIVEFSNFAVTNVINRKDNRLFKEIIKFLPKDQRKIIYARFNYLIAEDIKCIPLGSEAIESGLSLLSEFMTQYNSKRNFKNTVNDIFILAVARENDALLITRDSLLGRYASSYYAASSEVTNRGLEINFSKKSKTDSVKSRESKGYINKGWQYHILNHPNQ